VALGEQHCGEVAADGADGAGRSGHEDRVVVCGFHHHIAGLKLRLEVLANGAGCGSLPEGPLRSSAAQSSRADVSLAVRQADAAAVIPSNPHLKVIIPLLYSLATLPIAAL
jgi:hypothetical protein